MADSESDRSLLLSLSPDSLQTDGSPGHEETHGRRDDIDENTSLDEVKAPNVFERVEEEIEALVQTFHPKDETVVTESKEEKTVSQSDRAVIAANVFERAKHGIKKVVHNIKSKETHGQRDEIGEDTPLNEVKAPNLLERAVEEYEGFMQTIHSKKESQTDDKRDETAANAASTSASLQEEVTPLSDRAVIAAKVFERAKHEIKKVVHNIKSKEVAPLSEISSNEKMPINEVKGPDRAEDEMEAVAHTIKKETDSPAKEGFLSKLGKCLEIICSPSKEKDD